ncbi:MAG: glycosyltransferase family 2 protein [Spirochaetia bacterium]|nr:glycosyltransferase family 2 protein [Spirochaetia bacterium]
MAVKKKLLSIIIPAFNEADNIERTYKVLLETLKTLARKYDYEIIFTDNHSTDDSFEILQRLGRLDRRVKAIRFSRNFGYQKSILTGYLNASGAAAIQVDCDLQDPPEIIIEFVRKWEQGAAVVYGVRRTRKENWLINTLRKLFYRIVAVLSEDTLPVDAGDFRLVDRKIIEELKRMEDATPYLRGAIATMGYEQIGVPYDRAERDIGESKFSFSGYFKLAVDGIVNHSVIPLRIATYVGLVISVITFLAIIVYILLRIFVGANWPSGFTTITIFLLLSISLNALFLGVIGEYLARIFKQVKKRSLTLVENTVNFQNKT